YWPNSAIIGVSPCCEARSSTLPPCCGVRSAVCLLELRRLAYRMPGAAQCLGRLRRHVVLVVLGEDFACLEGAVGLERALRDDAAALLEEVGKDAGVRDGDRLRVVGDAEGHRRAVSDAFDAVGL